MITKARLKALNIYNSYDLAGTQPEPKVFVDYTAQDLGRMTTTASWQVLRIGYRTDPREDSLNGHNKTFYCSRPRENKEPMRLEALAWATERYGVQEWERSPFGSYHPKGTLAALAPLPEKDVAT